MAQRPPVFFANARESGAKPTQILALEIEERSLCKKHIKSGAKRNCKQAGKLAALGHLVFGITHGINSP